MRIVSITSPLLTLALLLQAPVAFAQDDTTDTSADEELSEEEQAALEEEEKAAAEAERAEVEKAEAEAAAQAEAEEAAAAEAEAAAVGVDETEGLWEPGQEPNRAAPAGKGVVWGRIVDSKNGEPAIEAQVKVLGTKFETFTDYDGYYRLELPPGKYKIQYFYELHEPETLDGVVSALGQVNRTDAKLTPQAGAVEEVLILEAAEKASLEGQLLTRQRSAAAQDGVGRAEIARTPDSTAAEAAQRVVGATIVGGRFVYVRGLGERYTNSLLHGAPLPSPDPNKAAVPLDMFPALVIDSINIQKTFTPDVPADFAGGSVQIESRDIPIKPLFSVSLKGGYNDQSTFRERPSYRGGSLDWLGLDDGGRAMPTEVPTGYPVVRGGRKEDGQTRITPDELTTIGRALNTSLTSTLESTLPNHGLSVVGGNGWSLGQDRRFGFVASVNYDRNYTYIQNGIERVLFADAAAPAGFIRSYDWRYDSGISDVRWGLFGSAMFQASKDHSFRLMGMQTLNSENRTNIFDGRNFNSDSIVHATRLAFTEQQMTLGMFRGEHAFPALANAALDYNLFLARATRAQPDTRDTVYFHSVEAGPPFAVQDGADSGRHFFSNQHENTFGGVLNWTQPLGSDDWKVKFGGLVNKKERSFNARRFFYYRNPRIQLRCSDESETFPTSCPDEHYTDDNIGTGSGMSALRVQEGTRSTDAFVSELGVYATYAMLDAEVIDKVRVVAGPRIEVTDQTARPVAQLGLTPDVTGAAINQVDVLPGLSVTYAATEKFKFRAAFSRTLARPQVRELAPFAFTDYFGGYNVIGNPNLSLTSIYNLDARVEYFPSLREVVAFSVFAKTFEDPIEPVIVPASDGTNITFVNTPGAKLVGVEAEFRKNLGFVSPVLNPFSLVTNLTLAWSRISVPQQGNQFLTNTTRPMVNQAPIVFNVALDYQNEIGTSARLLLNVTAPRVVQVGTAGLPDGYEQPRPMLDFVVGQTFLEHWEAKLGFENLLNSAVIVTQGPNLEEDDRNVLRRYTTGRIASLTLKYEY